MVNNWNYNKATILGVWNKSYISISQILKCDGKNWWLWIKPADNQLPGIFQKVQGKLINTNKYTVRKGSRIIPHAVGKYRATQ